jgi:hypothetical protein
MQMTYDVLESILKLFCFISKRISMIDWDIDLRRSPSIKFMRLTIILPGKGRKAENFLKIPMVFVVSVLCILGRIKSEIQRFI